MANFQLSFFGDFDGAGIKMYDTLIYMYPRVLGTVLSVKRPPYCPTLNFGPNVFFEVLKMKKLAKKRASVDPGFRRQKFLLVKKTFFSETSIYPF